MVGCFFKMALRKMGMLAMTLPIFFGGVAGCGPSVDSSSVSETSQNAIEKKLYYFTWSDYVDQVLLDGFKAKTGITVVVDTFSSNEELLAKVQSGMSGYDVVVPSDFMVSIMAHQGLLAKLDHQKIPNIQFIETFLKKLPFDPAQEYAVPYFWGTVGIGYDSDVIDEPPRSWDILWDSRFKGRISMLNDQREVFGMALRSLGYSLNSQDPMRIEQAKQKLIAQKPLVRMYTSETFDHLLVSGDIVLAHAWGGPVARAMQERPSIQYVVPQEGGTIWTDCLVVLESSSRKSMAWKFIDYLIETEVAHATSERLLFASANRLVKSLVAPSVRNNPAVYPPQEVIDRMEWMVDTGEAIRYYDRAWTELKVH
ncbi:spermidine/putrescine ABC transporter substrate-binding protein [Candidatus Nitronereus thalassa]|uniref:Spermidine/putrescine ABC transporter substrate-binding protein n=1 Tax=Candidatus Nitronereus thalassa TaxID=3020898 RepID=A0ABU3K5E7_9BACT|nr:spermidine/putrescine ABC transporter substrate-binding protein [Candidatus Nitronereus thalassa]MDT7041606.1 spermidine/putrescine ABC transporter substrate-binding protein [Candidatus Nitronereus thalassa]